MHRPPRNGTFNNGKKYRISVEYIIIFSRGLFSWKWIASTENRKNNNLWLKTTQRTHEFSSSYGQPWSFVFQNEWEKNTRETNKSVGIPQEKLQNFKKKLGVSPLNCWSRWASRSNQNFTVLWKLAFVSHKTKPLIVK